MVDDSRHSRFQPHPKSLLAFLVKVGFAAREPFVDIALAELAPQFSERAKETLLAAGMPHRALVDPNETVDSLTHLLMGGYQDVFLKHARRWTLAFGSPSKDGGYPRAVIAATVAIVHSLVGVSLKKTADFLNEGIPTCDLKAYKLTPKHVYDARNTLRRMIIRHAKGTGASLADLEGLCYVEDFHMQALLDLHMHARVVEQYRSMRGSALAEALIARKDFAVLLASAGRLVRARELSGDPFATVPIESNSAPPNAASPAPSARRGNHVKRASRSRSNPS